MIRMSDGSIESSNTPRSGFASIDKDYAIYRAIVVRAYFADDKESLSNEAPNPETIYDVIVIGGERHGNLLTNVRDSMVLGGQYNYFERTWRPSTKALRNVSLSKQDGDIVYVGFLGGIVQFPIILGGAAHPQSGEEAFAKKEDGPRMLFQYNGINVLIDKDGQLFFTRKKGELNSDLNAFVPNEDEDPHAKVSFEGEIIRIEDDNGNVITVDSGAQKITISSVQCIELNSDTIKMIAESEFTIETKTVNITADDVNVDATNTNINSTSTNINSTSVNITAANTAVSGPFSASGTVSLGGGGRGAVRLGDRAVGSGNHGSPVVSTIIQGSGKVFSG